MMHAQIVEGPLPVYAAACALAGAGAVVVFDGVVRGVEAGRPIDGLEYEAYRPMADRQLELLVQRACVDHGLVGCLVWHSVGFVAAGAVSFRLVVAGRHRKESLAAMDWFIETMKRDVPIWKRVVGGEPQPPMADMGRSG